MECPLKPIAEDIWELDRPQKIGVVQFNHRMTVVRLHSGTLWVHSPVDLDEGIQQALDALGEVGDLVAPSTFHDLYWKRYFTTYPEARFYCAPGVQKEHPEHPFDAALTDAAPQAWGEEIDQLLVRGMPKVNEVVFLHRSSRSLIVADLLFNLGRDLNLFSGILFWLFGTYGRIAVSRLFKAFIKDRATVRQSIDQILSWDFDRIVVGHGAIVEAGGRKALEQAYAFLRP